MISLRRHLASYALAVALLQLTLPFAAPFSACCGPGPAAAPAAAAATADSEDCCPPGSHPPGQCPLHRTAGKAARPPAAECRIRCSAPQASGFVLGVAGTLPVPPVTPLPVVAAAVAVVPVPPLAARPVRPEAPPPRLL